MGTKRQVSWTDMVTPSQSARMSANACKGPASHAALRLGWCRRACNRRLPGALPPADVPTPAPRPAPAAPPGMSLDGPACCTVSCSVSIPLCTDEATSSSAGGIARSAATTWSATPPPTPERRNAAASTAQRAAGWGGRVLRGRRGGLSAWQRTDAPTSAARGHWGLQRRGSLQGGLLWLGLLGPCSRGAPCVSTVALPLSWASSPFSCCRSAVALATCSRQPEAQGRCPLVQSGGGGGGSRGR